MARSFNGSSDLITPTGPVITVGNAWTGSAWVNPATPFGSFSAIFADRNASPGTCSYEFGLHNNGATWQVFSFAAATIAEIGSVTANVWSNVIAANDSSSFIAYVNGSGTTNAGSFVTGNDQGAWNIGNDTESNPYSGSLADVAIWNVKLTAGEASALANGARPWQIRPANLIAWWPLDGLQSPEPDLSGAKNNGTLTGTAKVFGPPFMQFTPRWPQNIISASAAAQTFQPAWATNQRIVVDGIGI